MTSHTLRRQLVEMGRLDLGIRRAKCVPMLLVTGNEGIFGRPLLFVILPIRYLSYLSYLSKVAEIPPTATSPIASRL
jgi:hypothetical protein